MSGISQRDKVIFVLMAMLLTVFSAGCVLAAPVTRTVLKVVPYPDIPGDFGRMLSIVEEGFEAQYPEIDLVLVKASVSDMYELSYLKQLLTNSTDKGGVDLVETDTIMMGDLAQQGLLMPETFSRPDWHPLIVEATTVEGVRYGVPHWLCGNFMITRDAKLVRTQGVDEMARRLRFIKPQGPWLAGNYAGNSYLVLYYAQAWGEDNPAESNLLPAITGPIVPATVKNLSVASSLCLEKGENPCVDGTYYNDFSPIFERTVRGDYAALQGFSESMWYMMQYGANPADWYIAPLPVGETTRNVLLGDAYIARRTLAPATAAAAEKFYAYMMQDSTYAAIIFSGGPKGVAVPRYLAPARMDIFSLPGLAADVYYQRVRRALLSAGGTNYPNLGVPANRDRIYREVMPSLTGETKVLGPRKTMMQHHRGSAAQ